MRTLAWFGCGLLISTGVVGCGDDDAGPTDAETGDAMVDAGPPPPLRPECENLEPTHCAMPYPSSHFLRADPTTETGFRVAVPDSVFPLNNRRDPHAASDPWNRFDGFSPLTSLVVGFRGEIDPANLPSFERIGESLATNSPTVLLDAETGERVPHFSEIDEWVNRDPGFTTFYIRPAIRLEENRRYVAAIRGLSLVGGEAVEASEYFAALRDGTPSELEGLEDRREALEDVFTVLGAAGVARDDLILAWDFHTASGPSLRGDMLAMRADGFARYDARTDGVGTCTVEAVQENVNDRIWRRIRGTFTVPLYMTTPYEGAVANRDGDGNIAYNGTAEAPFEVVIPPSVRDRVLAGEGPGRMLMYGHGLLGRADQVSSSGTTYALQRSAMVGFGTDYWGLSSDDTAQIISQVVTNFGNVAQLGERLMQGTLNSLILQKTFIDGPCSRIAELFIEAEEEGEEPLPLHDVSETYYYGISQGGIMGGTVAALSDKIDAYVLQVGAINYSLMLRRSRNFTPYEAAFKIYYDRKLDRDWYVVTMQSMWDLAEPGTYAPSLLGRQPIEGIDPSNRRILYQVARYDTQVPTIAADIAARTIGLPFFPSSVYEPWGVGEYMERADGPQSSGYFIYQLEGVEPIYEGSVAPPRDNVAHDDLRFTEPMLEQLERFCRPDGMAEDTCPDGSCRIPNERATL